MDASTRELRVDGERRETEPKAFDLLTYLIEHRDRAVSKDELLAEVWPRQIVTDTALTRAIMKARRAVGDDASRQEVIRTVHGHGYRFIPELAADSPAPGPASRPASRGRHDAPPGAARRSLASALVPIAVVTGLLIVAVGTWIGIREPAATSDPGQVAVLPVDSRLDDGEFDWVRLGLMSLMQRMLEEGGIDVVSDRAILAVVGDAAVDAPPDAEAFTGLRQKTGAGSLLYTALEKEGGLYRLSAVLTSPDGRKTRRVIVGNAPAELAAAMAGVITEMLTGATFRSGGRFARTSTDPFVNEMYARALDLELQGKLAEARQLFTLAAEQEPELFWLRYEIALCTRDLREWEEAGRQFDLLYAEAETAGDPRAMVVTLNSHGVMEFQRNRYDEAEELFLRANDAAEEKGLPTDRATTLINLALIATRRGRFDDASARYEAALDAYAESGEDPPPTFLNNYAGLLARLGKLDEAKAFSERAVAGFRVMGHRRYEAPSLNRQARILRRLGDIDGAIEKHREAAAIYRDLGNVVGELSAAGGLTTAYRARGDLSRARANAEDTLERARAADDELLLGDSLMRLGEVEVDAGDYDTALPLFEDALVIFQQLGDDEGSLGAQSAIARASVDIGDVNRARTIIDRLLAEAIENGPPSRVARIELLAGRVAAAEGDAARAAELYESALGYARTHGDAVLMPAAAILLGELELSEGRVESAAVLADEAREYARDDRDFLRFDARLAIASNDLRQAERILEQLRSVAGEAWTDEDDALLGSARSGQTL